MTCHVNKERKVLLKVSSVTICSGQALPQRTEENREKFESIFSVSDWIEPLAFRRRIRNNNLMKELFNGFIRLERLQITDHYRFCTAYLSHNHITNHGSRAVDWFYFNFPERACLMCLVEVRVLHSKIIPNLK